MADEPKQEPSPGTAHLSTLLSNIDVARDKYIYFVMAAAAAAIGFSMQLTSSLPWLAHDWLLILAWLFWAASFACGCINRSNDIMLQQTAIFLQGAPITQKAAERKRLDNRESAEDQSLFDRLLNDASKLWDTVERTNRLLANWQFYLFVAGAVVFGIWHVAGMIHRIPSTTSSPTTVVAPVQPATK